RGVRRHEPHGRFRCTARRSRPVPETGLRFGLVPGQSDGWPLNGPAARREVPMNLHVMKKHWRAMAAALLLLAAPLAAGAAAAPAGHVPASMAGKDGAFIDKYCSNCHNASDWAGGVALDVLDREDLGADGDVWEEVVRKLRGALMPPSSDPQPTPEERTAFIHSMEATLDRAASANPEPGSVVLHRLNRREYANAIRELLDMEVEGEALLPRDDLSGGFDNVAEVLKVSPSFLEQYFAAAREVSIQAVGNPDARMTGRVYPGDL